MEELGAACGCGVRAAGDAEVDQSQLNAPIERSDVELAYERSIRFRPYCCRE
jgi:hypothetical protein